MAEDLTEYYSELGVRVRYLHSDVDTLERVEILRDLRRGEFDVLVGINLLREGLDLPEVSLVGILDADKEGFLRSPRSLIQTIGRAARNAGGEVIMYADRVTEAMRTSISETERRRARQTEYNDAHSITPQTVRKAVLDMDPSTGAGDYVVIPVLRHAEASSDTEDVPSRIEELRSEMLLAAEELDFEKAAELRDEVEQLRGLLRPGAARRAKRDRRSQRPRR
jgi:excinuclease ABC subunit B